MRLIHQIHLLLCDLTKAYPNDLITKLWNVLNENDINPNLMRAIREIYRQ